MKFYLNFQTVLQLSKHIQLLVNQLVTPLFYIYSIFFSPARAPCGDNKRI